MTAPRKIALFALEQFRRGREQANVILDRLLSKYSPEPRDAAFALRLFYCTLQNLALCDFYIASYSSIKLQKLEPKVLDILRISLCQILFFEKAPDHAIVNEAVDLCKSHSAARAAGYVNALLRRVISETDKLPQPSGSAEERLSIQYSHPLWLVREYAAILGYEQTERLLAAQNSAAPLFAQVNTSVTDAEALIVSLAESGVNAEPHPWLDNCLMLSGGASLKKLPQFTRGEFYIQDPAARLAVTAAGIRPGMKVYDVCSSPGGKSFAAALDMHCEGEITSADISEKKLRRIREGAERLGFSLISAKVINAKSPYDELLNAFDAVIADVPCSGLGVIRKKPDVRYKDPLDFSGLPEIQLDILHGAAKCAAPGGVLIYSTCTVLERENSGVIDKFLSENPEFATEGFELPHIGGVPEGYITLWPHIHKTDGFFICKMRRRA